MNACVVVPAYNEEKRIGEVLAELVKLEIPIVVVDDGSSDETAQVAGRFNVIVARHMVNLGQGAALRTGTELAMKLGFETIMHFDADGQHDVEIIRPMLDALAKNEHDVIFASRFLGEKLVMPTYKKVILIAAKIFGRVFLQIKFTDPQSGLRAFTAAAYHSLRWRANDFRHCTEILINVARSDLRWRELPTIVRYDSYSTAKAKRPQMRMAWKMLMEALFR
ncbi:hypothetical protein A2482_00610 [Candidatus Falkowbacteria bacterium RIFOXYC2_FULL_48_21]|uniref:Glycosyltransferase 2-like domain-containing protein n=1 Tax=Candidatus Falkowbacteria bacterium RIFOXYC2_FULL_48_21 TaxID=1798005 RepID=A0A1F5T5P0_9BACT|nr:MAG: hypothetical protein A2482_00610 [Candidatus Falkowbacteria bacterium RIFOXYC2_FULL_48_21]